MIRLGELIVPLINLLEEVRLGYDVLQMDETTIQVLKEDGRAAQSGSRMWVRRGGRLTEDFKGYLQSDGFSGYEGRLSRARATQFDDAVRRGAKSTARRRP